MEFHSLALYYTTSFSSTWGHGSTRVVSSKVSMRFLPDKRLKLRAARYTSGMVRRGVFCLFVLSVSLAYGQLDSNSITVTASRSTAVQPDQVVFRVSVSSGLNTSLDDVLAALMGSGITRTNFSSVNTNPNFLFTGVPPPTSISSALSGPTLSWNFTLPVPLARMKDTVTALTALQKTIMQNNSGLTLTFAVEGLQVSPQLQQMQTCAVADLLSDARTEAQKLAK